MKRLTVAAAIAGLTISACASTPAVQTDADAHAPFASYRTYTWLQTPKQGSPLMQQRIVASIDAKLGALGWTRVAAPAADVAVAANVMTQKEHSIDTFYAGPGWGAWGWRRPTSVDVRTYTVGTLVVDMFDARSKQAIWRGTAAGTIPKSQEKASAGLQAGVDKMFAGFPVQPLATR